MITKEQYMNELDQLLAIIPEAERREWLYDYYMHFEQAALNGQTEHEAALELGDPKMIANELLLVYRVNQAETNHSFSKLSRAVFATVSLGLFNVIFVLGPYIACIAILITLWVLPLTLAFAGGAILFETLAYSTFTIPQAIALGLISVSITILLVIGLIALTKLFFKLTLKYLKFNTRIIRGDNK